MISNKNLCIGSANFGQNYGIFKNSKVTKTEFKKILSYCKNKKIEYFDTAARYENSEKFFGFSKINNFKPKISTKLPFFHKKIKNVDTWVKNNVFKSLYKLGVNNIDVMYFGETYDFSLKENLDIYRKIYLSLTDLRKDNHINKIGYSSYDYSFIRNKSFICPDVIQVPFNIFDQRILSQKKLQFFIKKKIKIYIRSIFLQGVLFNTKYSNKKFTHINEKLLNIDYCRQKLNLSRLEFYLNFINSFNFYEKIIIGVRSKRDLENIINCRFKKNFKIDFKKFAVSDKLIIDPRNWSKH